MADPTDLPLLLVDEHLVAINKPAGLLSIPDGYDPEKLHARALLEPHVGRLWIVHRLDRLTSGVMILARNANAHRQLNLQFQARRVHKVYHALVAGLPDWEARSIDLPLRVDGDRRHRTVVDHERGKEAHTQVRLIQKFPEYSLVEAIPKTGRTHQIRAHLTAIGYPLLGDALYGRTGSLETHPLGRPGLHALHLSLDHPTRAERLELTAAYPDDFKEVIQTES